MGGFALFWLGFSALAAIGGTIALYCTFLRNKNEGKFKGFLGWLYDFLTFRKLLVESILRVIYVVLALFVTVGSFAAGPWFLLVIIGGNLALRIVYEFALLMLVLCRNTSEINKKLSNVTIVKKDETNV